MLAHGEADPVAFFQLLAELPVDVAFDDVVSVLGGHDHIVAQQHDGTDRGVELAAGALGDRQVLWGGRRWSSRPFSGSSSRR